MVNLEFKTVTDLDKYYRESMRTLIDKHRLNQLSDYGFVHQTKLLDRKWERLYHRLHTTSVEGM